MRVQLNLASRPFVELGPVYRRLRILAALLALLALPLWWFLSSENQKAAAAKARLDAVQHRHRFGRLSLGWNKPDAGNPDVRVARACRLRYRDTCGIKAHPHST